jgi:DNA-binding LytR/AlgR family response regulator
VAVCTKTKKYITYLTFKSIEDFLPTDNFIKTHKSFIVSATKIDHIEGNVIRVGDHLIPISRTAKDEVMEKLLKGRFMKR